MNCTVCGNPLTYNRTVFHCSCGGFVHAYCWDEHILRGHRPPFEIGSVNLDDEFKPRGSRKGEQVLRAQAAAEQKREEQGPEEQTSRKQKEPMLG
jgi:hypothetical protein